MMTAMEKEGVKDEHIKKGHLLLSELNDCLLAISQYLPEKHPLLKELKSFRDKQEKRFEKLSPESTVKEGMAES